MFLFEGPSDAPASLLLAHGAGAAMDSAFMNAAVEAFAQAGLHVARFEFGYMRAQRDRGRRPPPRAEALVPEYRDAIDALAARQPLVIGGKSLGGRVASLLADEEFSGGRAAGLLCLGYPFHPVGKPDRLRTAHLAGLATPTLICQGTRDPLGSREEVEGYALSDRIELLWLEDGDHDLKPRKRTTGLTQADHLAIIAERTAQWVAGLVR
ncbi:alpha/beta hydrolase family protein [Roseitranquillus sediminis]|uniref:alpha/beta hydrolase family protein n=1 Tax=Roseitranquillus sediminis TaxID=2809051 RepID=UPI001D0BFE7D|nr:alpha/beta family hydrolase [Roseitranquillus sediminis]MBM9594174.1 alpha/beta hydrolase [Roseitranquillus sediminis]